MKNVFTVASAALLTGVLAAGCSGEPEVLEPDPTPTRATPDVPVPKLIPEARENTPSGAANFAIYWQAVSDYAAVTGSLSELRRISSPECKSCDTFIDLYEGIYEDDGYYTGGEHTLTDITVQPLDDTNSTILIRATSSMAAGTARNSAASEEAPTEPESNPMIFRVERYNDEWRLAAHAVDRE